jgi:hypothetical protein
LCVLLNQSREIFRKDLEPALRLIDSPVAGKICGRLTDACAIAHSINKALERNVSKEGAVAVMQRKTASGCWRSTQV